MCSMIVVLWSWLVAAVVMMIITCHKSQLVKFCRFVRSKLSGMKIERFIWCGWCNGGIRLMSSKDYSVQ
jgi:hypothetical protein